MEEGYIIFGETISLAVYPSVGRCFLQRSFHGDPTKLLSPNYFPTLFGFPCRCNLLRNPLLKQYVFLCCTFSPENLILDTRFFHLFASLLGDIHRGWFYRDGTTCIWLVVLPSGKRLRAYGKLPFLIGKSTISMAIFNTYVCLPQGTKSSR